MSSRKADELKAPKDPFGEVSGRVIDFQTGAAEAVKKRQRQRLLEEMRDMTTSEKQVFLLGLIMNEETLGRIWKNLIDGLMTELED
ncbi:MAG TPA: hypothetical protein VE262_23610 [Blastocatellia bacterium]|nr:hypothetical protein [Blastocatellia bacterium]